MQNLENGYGYALLVENTKDRYLHQEKTFTYSKFKKTKYALIYKVVKKDKSEITMFISYSNDYDKLALRLHECFSWYDYVSMKYKGVNQVILDL